MELPAAVICEACGAEACVPQQSIDEDAATDQLRGFDQTWREGYLLTIECPNCGRHKQQLTPPIANNGT
jgi:hypothetical protein